jgi:hypothetical protein
MDLGQLRQIFRAMLGRGHFDEIRAQLPPIYAEHGAEFGSYSPSATATSFGTATAKT